MFQRVLLDFVLKTFGLGAENETRTRDPNLGKVVLYQLSYFRIMFLNRATFIGFASAKVVAFFHSPKLFAKKIQKNRIFFRKTTFEPSISALFVPNLLRKTTPARIIIHT